ncbi:hypothetical protein [Apibacter sp. HY039]|uniref:hypothetical protein n=1 Tax=Apibacter sp. HY039 TaxID=2501476 RepID=UPI000FEB880F|nr:hypothetical protein [Apibacter sp. HY039]
MLEKQNKIIIVDNIPAQLEILGKSFFENGLGCRTFVYDPSYDSPLEKVRIAFFDINLTEKVVDADYESNEEILEKNTSVFNDLAYAINQYISKNNGPYVLIFWTANSKIADAFKLYISDPDRGYSDTASPIFIDCIDKTPFADNNGEQNNLSDKILELLNGNEKIKFLFNLQENCRKSGEETINRLYQIIPKEENWGESTVFFENLDIILSKIASSTLGCQHAKENNQKAIYEGLLPIINYELINSENTLDWLQILTKLNQSTDCKNLVIQEKSIENKLNSLYHIEKYTNQTKNFRGCVIEINKHSIEPLKSLNILNTETWVSKMLAVKEGNETQKKRKSEILNNSKIIAIEISASCDFSNNKSRINKYILGVLCNNLNKDLDKDLNLKSRPEFCYHLGGCCFYHEENDYNIFLNLNYVFSSNFNDLKLGNVLFILKKEIMDMLGNKYASHISRIGITSL